jgi:hypothetical protein
MAQSRSVSFCGIGRANAHSDTMLAPRRRPADESRTGVQAFGWGTVHLPAPAFAPGLARHGLVWRPPTGSRGILALAARGGAVVLVSLAAYVGVQVWLRTEWRQKRAIRRRLREAEDIGKPSHESGMWLERPERLAFLRACIEGSPSGPLVVTGPEGSGKSTLLRQALGGRPNCWFMDLREIPVTTGDQLVSNFIARTGFLPPPDELLGQVVFARSNDPAKARGEVDKALRFITGVLREVQRDQTEALRREQAAVRAAAVASATPKPRSVHSVGMDGEVEVTEVEDRTKTPVIQVGGASVPALTPQQLRMRSPRAISFVRQQTNATGGLRPWTRDFVKARAWQILSIAPPWVRKFVQAVQEGLGSTFAVELQGDDEDSLPDPDDSASLMAPLICLDELHIISNPEDPSLHSLLDWFQFVTDSRLAHVVLGCSADFAEKLDKHRGFRNRRQRIHVDFPRSISVRNYLIGPVNAELARRGRAAQVAIAMDSSAPPPAPEQYWEQTFPTPAPPRKDKQGLASLDEADVDFLTSLPITDLPAAARLRPLTAEEVEIIVTAVGGHMKDLDSVVRQLLEGHSYQSVLERLLADSVDSVESFVENTLLEGHPVLPGGVFRRESPGKVLTHTSLSQSSTSLGPEMTERAEKFLRFWNLMEELSRRKYVSRRELTTRLYSGHSAELDELTGNGLIMCANLRSTRKLRATTQPSLEHDPPSKPASVNFSSLTESPSFEAFSAATRYVSAAAPRLRLAFRIITSNKSLLDFAQRVRAILHADVLRKKLALLHEKLKQIASERAYYADRVEKLTDLAKKHANVSLRKQWWKHEATSTGDDEDDFQEELEEYRRYVALRANLVKLEQDAADLRDAIAKAQQQLQETEDAAMGGESPADSPTATRV